MGQKNILTSIELDDSCYENCRQAQDCEEMMRRSRVLWLAERTMAHSDLYEKAIAILSCNGPTKTWYGKMICHSTVGVDIHKKQD